MYNQNLQRYHWEPYAGKPHVRFCGGGWSVMGISTLETSLLKTIEKPTLCLDFEAGMLAVQDWTGDSVNIRTWNEARDIACLIGGPNPALRSDSAYSTKHYDSIKAINIDIDKYECIFIDSITFASKLCLTWCKNQPDSLSDKTGKIDLRNVYGLLANEMSAWLNQFQHIPNKDVIFVGLLEQKLNEFNRITHNMLIDGSKTSSEIMAVLDEIICMMPIKNENGDLSRTFVCKTLNTNSLPAKDRSGRLGETEKPHLGDLIRKIRSTTSTQIIGETI